MSALHVALAGLLMLAMRPDPAAAFDASGVWIGRQTCTGFGSDGKMVTKNLGSTLLLSQSGRHAAIEVDGARTFGAVAIETPDDPDEGHLGIVACGTSDTFTPVGRHEVGRLAITTKPNGKATIKGTSIESRGLEDDAVLTCQWSYKRFYVSFPAIDRCEDLPTPTPTATPAAKCPAALEVATRAGSRKVLDQGWTGLAHNATIVSNGTLTFALDCDGQTRPCGVCDVSGPIPNADANDGAIDARRCTNDLSVTCSVDSQCGVGVCRSFFGPPLPLSAGGISTCVINQVNGAVTGTANVESGAFAMAINLTSRVYNQIAVDQPCPRCEGDSALNDGSPGGTCNGGARHGHPCDANGTSPVPTFGTTSLDCPPLGLISALSIPLNGSTGIEKVALSAASPNCVGFGDQDKKCFCPFAGTEPTRPNGCVSDDSSTPFCASILGTSRGQCAGTPVDRVCSPLETSRACTSNAECQASGDTCVLSSRPCYPDNGVIGGTVEAHGETDAPTNGVAHPTFAALFCIPPVAQPAVNSAGGFPGLGRLELPLVTREIATLPSP